MKLKSANSTKWLGVALGSAMTMGASVAHSAIVEVEGNDTFATANAGTIGSTHTGTIGDASAASNDVDIWSFNLNAGSTLNTSISYTGLYNASDANPVMTLFMENGGSYYSVASTDPSAHGTGFSFTAWATGNYFLAITADFNQGLDAFGNASSDAYFQSTESILGTAFDSFAGNSFTSFSYEVSAVPVPAAVWLFGSGLLGLVGMARRRKA